MENTSVWTPIANTVNTYCKDSPDLQRMLNDHSKDVMNTVKTYKQHVSADLYTQPLAFGVSFNLDLNLQSQFRRTLSNGTREKMPRELDHR